MVSLLRSFSWSFLVAAVAACGGSGDAPKCIPGASVDCACPTGQHGAQTCSPEGSFTACVCAPVGDGAVPGGSGGATAPPASTGTGGQPSSGTGGIDGAPVAGTGGSIALGGAISAGGAISVGGLAGTGGITGNGGLTNTGGLKGTGGITSLGGIAGRGGTMGAGGVTAPGGAGGSGGATSTPSSCGNGARDPGEQCDCGTDAKNLPAGCKAPNGFFYGDGKGCTTACTNEPSCLDASGKTQACTTSCGDGTLDLDEACDDGNLLDGDGCSKACKVEGGFTCTTETVEDSAPCASGSGQCLTLPMILRDFQPENASAGHPDFPFLGTRFNSSKPTTICVPNSSGPAKSNDSTARCWGIVADSLLKGKPQPGPTTTCACQFSDWSIASSSRIPGGYTAAGNDSPLSDGDGGYQGGNAGAIVNTISTGGAYIGTLFNYTASTPGGPIWKGTVPAYKDKDSFDQWFNDAPSVNQTFTSFIELAAIGSSIYRYASPMHLTEGFYPLDKLNPSQATLCNLWPYWNHGNGQPIFTSCRGDQYLFPPKALSSDCSPGDLVDDGCWVTQVVGAKRDSYFTDEVRYHFVYDGSNGISIRFYGDDDLFVFINGVLVLDLGGIHAALPGKVTVHGDPGDAQVVEGGCLDAAGEITGAAIASHACSPTSSGAGPGAASPADFRVRTVKLGLQSGRVYELAIFGADRHPPESNFQLILQGFTRKRSSCKPN